MQPTGRDTGYKSREFVETDSDDDTTTNRFGYIYTFRKEISVATQRQSPKADTKRVLCITVAATRDTTRHTPTSISVITDQVKNSDASSSSAAETETSTQSPI